MLRLASQRLFAASRQPISRPLSSSAPLFIRVKHVDGSKTSPSPKSEVEPTPAGQPTPAPNPSHPPPNISTPPPAFEPTVQKAGAATATSVPASGSVETASTPAEQPEVEELKDFSKLPSLDVDSEMARLAEPEPEPVKKEGETGARSKRTGAGRKEYVSSIEKQRRQFLRISLGALLVGGLGAVYFGGEEKPTVAGEPSVGGFERLKQNTNEFLDYFNKPAFKTLLPDPLPAPHQKPYTLLIDMEGMLVTSTWDRTNGWRTAKRPGVDYFLAYLSLFYEIVLFTHQPSYTAIPVAEKLDPFQAYMPYKLFRDSTRTVNGKVVKDLTYLNRDLGKVIMIDNNAEHAALQPDNAIIIPAWEGKGGDKGLVELIPFLESIAYYNVQDVRPTLKHYQGKDIAKEYAMIEEEQKKKAVDDWERSHASAVTGAGSGFLTSMFGSVGGPGRSRPTQPMTYIEQKRAESQRMYQEEQKYWRDHSEEFKKLIEDDKQKQLAEMKGNLWQMMGGPAKPPTQPEQKAQK